VTLVTPASAQLLAPVQRTFAEFPFTRSWQEIAIHAQRLEGASHVGLFGERKETWLRFIYEGEDFCIQDGNLRLTITVDDATCPEQLLREVRRHFVSLFSPELSE
jgi:hypothetical protein